MLRSASHWLALSHRRLLIGQRAPISRVGRLLVQSQRSSVRLLSNRSFRESIEKIKNEGSEKAEEAKEAQEGSAQDAGAEAESSASAFIAVKSTAANFWEGLKDTTRELFNMKKPSRVTQRLRADDDAEEETQEQAKEKKAGEAKQGDQAEEEDLGDPLAGTAIQVVKDVRSYWDRLLESLRHAPMIENIMETGRLLSKTEAGQQATKVTHAVKDKVEDAKEYWETTQNPVVVKLASMWDSVTRETDQGIAIRELRRLDPAFTLEEWTEDVMENLVPTILEAHVKGNPRVLKRWTGEALYNKLNAEITQRKSEGIQLDEHILAIEEANVINVAYEEGAGQSPIIVLQFMVQQIHCIRKNGEIVEGREDEVNANYYVMAFQREYNEVEGLLQWKVVDMMLAGKFPYW